MHWLKAKLFLLAIALIWGYLILVMLPFQLIVTLLPIWLPGLSNYRWRYWIGQDQFVNAILGGNPDITISSKVGYMSLHGSRTAQAVEIVIDWLFRVAVGQEQHCFNSIEFDEAHNTWQR